MQGSSEWRREAGTFSNPLPQRASQGLARSPTGSGSVTTQFIRRVGWGMRVERGIKPMGCAQEADRSILEAMSFFANEIKQTISSYWMIVCLYNGDIH